MTQAPGTTKPTLAIKTLPAFKPLILIAALISGHAILKRSRICRNCECHDGQRKKPASENCFHRFCLVSVTSMTAVRRRVKVAATPPLRHAGCGCAGGMDRAGDQGAVTGCLQRSIQVGLMPAIHSAGQHVLEVRTTRNHYMACPLTEPALPSLQFFRAHIAALLRWASMLC